MNRRLAEALLLVVVRQGYLAHKKQHTFVLGYPIAVFHFKIPDRSDLHYCCRSLKLMVSSVSGANINRRHLRSGLLFFLSLSSLELSDAKSMSLKYELFAGANINRRMAEALLLAAEARKVEG